MKKKLTVPYGIVQCVYWMGFAVIGGFASAYLLTAGLSNFAIGIVLSGGSLSAAILQPFVGALIDKSRCVNNRWVLIVISFITVILCIALSCFATQMPAVIGLIFALCYIMLQLSQPFTNALAMECVNAGYPLNFGPARAAGSLGYAAISYVIGLLTVQIGIDIIPIVGAIVFALLGISLLALMPNIRADEKTSKTNIQKQKTGGLREFVKKYPAYIVMLLGLVCIFYTHTMINVYALQILQTKGGDSADVGRMLAIAAGVEIIPMITFPLIAKKIKLKTLVRVSTIVFTLKVVATLLAPNVGIYMLVQLLQIGGWGTIAVALVLYVNKIVDEKDASQGQAYAGVSTTLGTVIATLISGWLLDKVGVDMTLIVGTMVGALGVIVVFASTRKLQ